MTQPRKISSPNTIGESMAKFMLSLRDENFQLLVSEAQDRGISIQELIRAVIIPDWVKTTGPLKISASTPIATRRVPPDGNGREQLVQPLGRNGKPGNHFSNRSL